MARPEPPSLQEVAANLRRGERALLAYLEQLEARFHRLEPQVQAFVPERGRFGRLKEEAVQLVAMFPDPAERPPLFGVPIGVKDIFHVTGFVTRAGTRVDSARLQGEESAAIGQMREAGALILGKTITTEFAYFAPGPTRNPHNLAHTPGGSSSGSAAAVGAGLAPLAFGTQTIGSINRPAAFCGVVGFKPSHDRISKMGVIPVSPSADHVGYFVPRAADAALVAPLLCREWQAETPQRKPVLGVPQGTYLTRASEEGIAHYDLVCRRLSDAGYEVRRVPLMPDFQRIYDQHQALVAYEAAQTHRDWYADQGYLYHEKTAGLIKKGQQVEEQAYREARQNQLDLRTMLGDVMAAEGIDLWLSPAAVGPAPLGLESTGDPVMNLPWTHGGVPTLTLPSGLSANGLPLALQLAAGWYEDERLLAWAPLLEQALSRQLI